MNKYQNLTFKSGKEAIAYKQAFKDMYGFESREPIIKIIESTDRVPKGLIILALDENKNSYVLNPFYGCGYFVYIPKKFCKKVC